MVATKAFITAYRQEALIPSEDLGWGDYGARLYRYQLSDLYYSNAIYKNLSTVGSTNANRKIDMKLYKRVRGVYNPVFRLVETYVSKVYGGELDFDKLEGGAFPVKNADDALRMAIRQQLLYSNWRANKSLFVRHGSKLGDVFLKVVDDTAIGRTRVEIVHPGKVKDFEKDSNGKINQVIIEYEACDENEVYKPQQGEGNEQTYTYTEIINNDEFQFYRDGKPYDYINRVENGPFAIYGNEYGFVPLVHCMHRDEGVDWGSSAFNNSLDKIDELNDQASLLNDAIRKGSDITWLMLGLNKPDNKTTFADDNRDDMKALYVPGATPAEVDAKPLVPTLAIADTIANIEQLQAELERDMPELSMHHLRESAQQTAPGIRAAYNDAIDRFQEAQGVYDAAAMDAFNMSIAISGLRGYDGFKGYSADTYKNGLFDWYVQPRPIIDDELSKQEKITAFISSSAPSRWIWKELGISEDEIAQAEQEAEAKRQEMMDATSFNIGGNNADPNN